MHILTSLGLPSSSVFVVVIEGRILILHPLDELNNVLVLKKAVSGVIVVQQLAFGKGSVDLVVTDFVQGCCGLALEGFRDKVVLVNVNLAQWSLTQGAQFFAC
jgi:hypothetical protein